MIKTKDHKNLLALLVGRECHRKCLIACIRYISYVNWLSKKLTLRIRIRSTSLQKSTLPSTVLLAAAQNIGHTSIPGILLHLAAVYFSSSSCLLATCSLVHSVVRVSYYSTEYNYSIRAGLPMQIAGSFAFAMIDPLTHTP